MGGKRTKSSSARSSCTQPEEPPNPPPAVQGWGAWLQQCVHRTVMPLGDMLFTFSFCWGWVLNAALLVAAPWKVSVPVLGAQSAILLYYAPHSGISDDAITPGFSFVFGFAYGVAAAVRLLCEYFGGWTTCVQWCAVVGAFGLLSFLRR
eukprot:GDKI01046406.1.p1 GENE.GDKI01046406.1~~GDKI01046406.1.p1  ORF type:complete len:149 (+),score=18.94 GDKI01046406.1:183-629(+)